MRPFLLATLTLMACNNRIDPFDPSQFPVRDADSDADTDADADSDADADTDVDTPPPTPDPDALQCDTPYPTPDPNAGGSVCVTEYVSCGDEIFATLNGGTELYDFAYWQSLSEIGALTNDNDAVNGLERIYVLEDVFPGTYVTATIESCDDVWGSYLVTGDLTDVCHNGPTNAPRGHFTSIQFGSRKLQEKILENSASGVWDVQFIVDTHPASTGNFKITFECGAAAGG
jgi:hypothetical protein